MKDPPRWLDDPTLPAQHRRLLLAAHKPPPLIAAQHVAFTTLVGKLAAAGVIGKLAAASLVTKVIVVSTTMSAAMLTGYLAARPSGSRETSRVTAVAAAEHQPPVGLAATNLQPQPAASSTGAINEISESSGLDGPARAPAKPLAKEPATIAEPPAHSIRDEAAMLENARRALSESPMRALFLADEHAERFRAGQLAAERELIAVQALVSLGRMRAAEERARRFSKQYTSSVYQRRLEQVLGARAGVDRHLAAPGATTE